MLAYPKDKKWLLICQNKEKAKTAKMGPKEFVAKLQEGKVKSTTIAHLASSLNGEPKAWAQEFLAEGGLQLLITLLGKLADKEECVIELCMLNRFDFGFDPVMDLTLTRLDLFLSFPSPSAGRSPRTWMTSLRSFFPSRVS
jgi:hypothetical protein